MCHWRVSKNAKGRVLSEILRAALHCRHAGGKRLPRRQHNETAPARLKGQYKTSNKDSATSRPPAVREMSPSGRALRARARSPRGKGAENGTKGTCAEQRAVRGGRFLGQERRGDQASGVGAASRSQRRSTLSPWRASGGSAHALNLPLSALELSVSTARNFIFNPTLHGIVCFLAEHLFQPQL